MRRFVIGSVALALASAPGVMLAAEGESSTSGTFGMAGSLAEAREFHTATTLPDGRVLVVGGDGNSAEVWDPTTESLGAAGSLAERRRVHTATLLPDGRVLVAGGEGGDDGHVASAEVWDPATSTFAPAALPDGRVLVVTPCGWTGF